MSNEATGENFVDTAWDIADSIRTCMLITWDGTQMRARPMSGTVEKGSHSIYFLTDATGRKIRDIQNNSEVTLIYSAEGANKYATIAGTASVSNDRDKIRQLFTPFAKAWWESAEDPSIRLVRVEPREAEIWEGPNKLIATTLMLTAAITGSRPDIGSHARVDL